MVRRTRCSKGIVHRPDLRVAGVEKYQHQVRQVDDVVRDAQGGRALGVGVEAGRVDQDPAAQLLACAGLELEVGVDAATLPLRHLVDGLADAVEREARVGIQRQAGQHPHVFVVREADDRELVIHGLVAGGLQAAAEEVVDEAGFSRGVDPQHRDKRPPGRAVGVGLAPVEKAEAAADAVQILEAVDNMLEDRIFLLQSPLQVPEFPTGLAFLNHGGCPYRSVCGSPVA